MMEPVLISLTFSRPQGCPLLEVLDPTVVRVPTVREMGQQLAGGCWLSEVSDRLLFPLQRELTALQSVVATQEEELQVQASDIESLTRTIQIKEDLIKVRYCARLGQFHLGRLQRSLFIPHILRPVWLAGCGCCWCWFAYSSLCSFVQKAKATNPKTVVIWCFALSAPNTLLQVLSSECTVSLLGSYCRLWFVPNPLSVLWHSFLRRPGSFQTLETFGSCIPGRFVKVQLSLLLIPSSLSPPAVCWFSGSADAAGGS